MPKVMTSPLAVTVIDARSMMGIAGAKLAVDDKKMKRVEATTDANGAATVMIDWSQAPVAITAYADGHALASFLGVTKNDTWQVRLIANGAAPTGTMVMGTVKNKDMDSDPVTLSASVPAGYYQDVADTYTFPVYEDMPYSIYALDWVLGGPKTPSKRGVAQTFKKWVQVDAPAPSSGKAVDIDFAAATPLTSMTASGTVSIPANSTDILKSSVSYITVTDGDSGYAAFLGAVTFIDVATDGNSFSYDMNWVQPTAATKPITEYIVQTAAGAFTVKNDANWPAGGTLSDLIDIAAVTQGPLPLNITEAPTFTAPGGDSNSFLGIQSNAGSQNAKTLWYVYGPAGTALIAPAPPTGVDIDQVLPPASLSGQIFTCSPAKASLCVYYSASVPFAIAR
jgi:hypothetical protein